MAKSTTITAPLEVIPAREEVLTDASKALEKLRVVIVRHEDSFHAATLGPRLQIGLQCLKAHQVFSLPEHKKRGAMKGKKLVTRDELFPESFEGWLSTEAKWLKRPTAYKYMTAVRGLGLDHDATTKQVAAALKHLLRKGPVSIKSLCDTALDAVTPPAPEPKKLQQSEFEFLKQGLTAFREEAEHIVAIKPQLEQNPDMLRAATARAYQVLRDLTGTDWRPSDVPDALATVDPDAISI